jgi:hypothetical protein
MRRSHILRGKSLPYPRQEEKPHCHSEPYFTVKIGRSNLNLVKKKWLMKEDIYTYVQFASSFFHAKKLLAMTFCFLTRFNKWYYINIEKCYRKRLNNGHYEL